MSKEVADAQFRGGPTTRVAVQWPQRVPIERALIASHIPRLAKQRRLDPELLFAALQVMPIDWKPAGDYDDQRQEAERRIAASDPALRGGLRLS